MSSIVLSAGAAKVGGAIGGVLSGGNPLGAALGSSVFGGLGKLAGTLIDNKLLAPSAKLSTVTGVGVSDTAVQSSAYGKVIPIVYGTNRIAGNIIWSQPIKEVVTTTTSSTGGGKGGGGTATSTSSQTSYSYFITLAIAICEGEIDDVLRVWADSKLLNPDDGVFRLYKGTETQTADSLIESIEGVGATPAYRGLAYVVIEDFPLADYGNRIPNFTFEVQRKSLTSASSETSLEEDITAMVMIPGAGEYVYDDTVQFKIPGEEVSGTFIQKGNQIRINQNNRSGKADALVSLDHLKSTCPNLEWVAPVVVWFGNDLDAGGCTIKPGVDFSGDAKVSPDSWTVGSFDRDSAYLISTDAQGRANYGGTPNDASLLRYLTELKSRGYSIMFNPMLFMDVDGKPWRGEVTGSVSDVSAFFTKTNGYNAFILHYANLVKNHVDAFIIGSELIGLTSVQDTSDDSFPAVDALVSLAASVKTIVGSGVKVTYAADWSEYHHTTDGWYNLDPLWASSNIDFIGIDCYFPLTNEAEPVGGFDIDTIKSGWTSGEGYDFVYTDTARTTTASISPEFAWKNIAYWWENYHTNPDETTSSWVPESKKIWFTELGYPSVDGATNQPNVFYDPSSDSSSYPRFSRGASDFRAQRNALKAAFSQWKTSTMVEEMFIYAWDARPFPFWPDLASIWSDGAVWRVGHWVQGKLGTSSLGAIIRDLTNRVDLDETYLDISRLNSLVDGFVIDSQVTARQAIDQLRQAFFFDVVESDSVMKFVPRGSLSVATITKDNLVQSQNNQSHELLSITRTQELELPRKVDINYINPSSDYQAGNQHSQRSSTFSEGVESITLPIVMSSQAAKELADVTLFNRWLERTQFEFMLPIHYARVEPTDVITLSIDSFSHVVRVVDVQFGAPGLMQVTAVAEDLSAYRFDNAAGSIASNTQSVQQIPETIVEMLDLPALPFDIQDTPALRFAAAGLEKGWKGASIYRSDDGGASYRKFTNIPSAAAVGTAATVLGTANYEVFDYANTVTVSLYGEGVLEGTTRLGVLNGSNAALLGDEIIQFQQATLVEEGKYTLSGLLRGRLGTEQAISSHAIGERFVLLGGDIIKEVMPTSLIGLERIYKAVTLGATLTGTTAKNFTFQALSLKPYAPVHLRAERDGSSNITFSWTRRTRVDGEWRNNVDVALGETAELYEVEILNGSNNVLRTIENITQSQTEYSAANQVLDLGSTQSAVKIRVYQISEAVGRGYMAEATL